MRLHKQKLSSSVTQAPVKLDLVSLCIANDMSCRIFNKISHHPSITMNRIKDTMTRQLMVIP